ncbi:LysR family transcriptional regulator [Alphaproteobacteria bacterium]|nr:LysR family transcriptional regulator [Alphaproteobacteria bacterium]
MKVKLLATRSLPPLSDIDLRLLRVYRTIVECGGFTQAQAELGISRSTISTHMSNLETRLGLTLCRRGRSGFALTERGRLVYESVSKFLTALEGFRSELGELQGRMTGEIKIGMVDNLTSNSSCKLYEAIDKFRAQTQDVHLIIQVVAPNQIDNWLTRGLLHLAIVTNLPSSDAINSETIFHERQELYCSSTHPLFDMDPKLITKDIISQQAFVRRGYSVATPYDSFFNEPAAATAYHMEGVAQFILSGKYVGFLPCEFAQQQWVDNAQMRSLLPNICGFEVPISVSYSNLVPLSLPASVFHKIILEAH